MMLSMLPISILFPIDPRGNALGKTIEQLHLHALLANCLVNSLAKGVPCKPMSDAMVLDRKKMELCVLSLS